MSTYTVPSRRAFTGVRLSLQSTMTYDETEQNLIKVLNGADFVPGKLLMDGVPYIMKGDKEGFEDLINTRSGRHGFVLFEILRHTRWLTFFHSDAPRMATFTIGSPLMTGPYLYRYHDAGLQVPMRLNIVEINDGDDKCRISWDLPSSMLAIGAANNAVAEEELREGAAGLDAKMESLIREVLGIQSL